LHALVRLAPRLDVSIEVATVNHGLRPEAAGEVAEVAARCRRLGVPCEVIEVDVRAARTAHVSWQDAARRVRLAALEEAARRRGCGVIALGHTADDQAETVLFRIVRGTSVNGLAGMPYRRGPFVRPLLDVRRASVLRFLEKRRLPYFEDPSNADRRFTRARVRHEWLPFFARENPRVVEALLALAGSARQRPVATAAAVPLARRAAATVARLAAAGAGTHLVAVAGGTVEVSYGKVKLLPGPPRPRAAGSAVPIEVRGSGTYRVGPRLALDVQERHAEPPRAAGIGLFDADRLAVPLRVRAPRAGDRMRPRGGRGSRKLSDLLIDAKIPRGDRAELPVLEAADGTILFVPGLRPSEAGRPRPETRRWLEVQVRSV
jgi:tRNA(Ile)-lysidine synthase